MIVTKSKAQADGGELQIQNFKIRGDSQRKLGGQPTQSRRRIMQNDPNLQ